MTTIFGIPLAALFGQLVLGLINGSFYALLSLGFAIIFGLLNIVNFAHGAFYMVGAFSAWMLATYFGIGYWPALLIAPVAVGLAGTLLERAVISRLYRLDGLYILLLTFGCMLVIQGGFRILYGNSGLPYPVPDALKGGFMIATGMFLPTYRGWVVIVSAFICLAVWYLIEKTRLGSYLRAATENPQMTEAFGINVPRLLTVTFGIGVGLAACAGVLAAPIYSVNPTMGADLMIVVFAVVVIGGMGSILGSILTGYMLGVVEGFTKMFYPEASGIVIFIIMVLVLAFKPNGLFGKAGA